MSENHEVLVTFPGIILNGETYIFLVKDEWQGVNTSEARYVSEKHIILKRVQADQKK